MDVVSRKVFYRGQYIIKEGTNEQFMYVIETGTANLVKESQNNKELFHKLEIEEDPTRAKRYKEIEKAFLPHKKPTLKDLY